MSDAPKADASDDIAWGCAEIAKVIGRTKAQTFHLLSKGYLPVQKVGGLWVGSRRRLRQHVTGEVE